MSKAIDAPMSIGAFARRSRLSLKALRLYGRLGPLGPDHVDSVNGYRRYAESQLATARLIGQLRRLDMPIAEVGRAMALPGPVAAERIAAFWETVERRTAFQRELAMHLRIRLSSSEERYTVCQWPCESPHLWP